MRIPPKLLKALKEAGIVVAAEVVHLVGREIADLIRRWRERRRRANLAQSTHPDPPRVPPVA